MLFASAVSRCDVDKRDFIHFVYSVRWHCTNSMKTMGLNENIDRTVLGECNIRPEGHRRWKIKWF